MSAGLRQTRVLTTALKTQKSVPVGVKVGVKVTRKNKNKKCSHKMKRVRTWCRALRTVKWYDKLPFWCKGLVANMTTSLITQMKVMSFKLKKFSTKHLRLKPRQSPRENMTVLSNTRETMTSALPRIRQLSWQAHHMTIRVKALLWEAAKRTNQS